MIAPLPRKRGIFGMIGSQTYDCFKQYYFAIFFLCYRYCKGPVTQYDASITKNQSFPSEAFWQVISNLLYGLQPLF